MIFYSCTLFFYYLDFFFLGDMDFFFSSSAALFCSDGFLGSLLVNGLFYDINELGGNCCF